MSAHAAVPGPAVDERGFIPQKTATNCLNFYKKVCIVIFLKKKLHQ